VEGKGKGNQERREKAEEYTVGERGGALEKAREEGIDRCASKRVQKRASKKRRQGIRQIFVK